jgi:hypothetical protein
VSLLNQTQIAEGDVALRVGGTRRQRRLQQLLTSRLGIGLFAVANSNNQNEMNTKQNQDWLFAYQRSVVYNSAIEQYAVEIC